MESILLFKTYDPDFKKLFTLKKYDFRFFIFKESNSENSIKVIHSRNRDFIDFSIEKYKDQLQTHNKTMLNLYFPVENNIVLINSLIWINHHRKVGLLTKDQDKHHNIELFQFYRFLIDK